MAASSFIYTNAKGAWQIGRFCYWSSTTASFYITLVSNSYTPNESDRYVSALSGHELSAGAGFSAGYAGGLRISLTGRVLNINTTSNQAECQANSVLWSSLPASAGVIHAWVVLQQSGTDALSELFVYNSFGLPISANGTTFTISFTSAGVAALLDF